MKTPNPQSSSLNPGIIVPFFCLIFCLHPCPARSEDDYSKCDTPYSCGRFQDISYPFWGSQRPLFCGLRGFELSCYDDNFSTMKIGSVEFGVLEINQNTRQITVVRSDLVDNPCPSDFKDTRLDYTLFDYTSNITNITLLYGCQSLPIWVSAEQQFYCPGRLMSFYANDSFFNSKGFNPDYTYCNHKFRVPVFKDAIDEKLHNRTAALQAALNRGFVVEYGPLHGLCKACKDSGGLCGSNSTNQLICFCGGHISEIIICPAATNNRKKIIIGVSTGLGGMLLMGVSFFIWLRCKKRQNYAPSSVISRSIASAPSSLKELEKGGIYNGVHVFPFKELEEATNKFDPERELGDGGFGTVYYGKLRDGRAVAVKRLYENNCRRLEQFMTEIEILARLRHENLVSLYGCTSRHSRELLLVYEYVPNGTVADHLHGDKRASCALQWPARLNIAIETASALAYLHASEVIHRDVKTNNILLDNNYSVKVADFGLSRLFPTNVTHVSTAPQGTPGYVDPEYHECYQLTSKSDVYSFGVVLAELISSMPAVDITRHRHDINLSNMAINKIRNRALHELVDPTLGFESDHKIREMITDVAELAFRCLQSVKDARPSMVETLEALQDIQNQKWQKNKAAEIDIFEDDVLLPKREPMPPSPDSVTVHWISTSTISDTSS